MTGTVVNFETIRREAQRRAHGDKLCEILDVLHNAKANELRECLFWGASQFRDDVGDNMRLRKSIFWVLRGAWGVAQLRDSGSLDIPADEVERIISAGLYKGKRR